MRKKTEEKRQSIVEAAFEVFREVGFDRASMSDIATRSGASKATLYSYFESKESLYAEAMTRLAADEIRQAFGQLRLDVPLRESLVAFGREYLVAILRPSILAIRRMCFQEGDRSRLGRAIYEAGPKRGWGLVRDFLEGAMAAGSIRECDPGIAAHHLEALYEAELVDIAALGYTVNTKPAAILPVVERAVDVFLAAYALPANESRAKVPASRARKSAA